ncbi:MAG: lamin tail domain-containing protein [Clostridia bacterium]|nr:lamin tail domain-containing protein [Clostridia bacterium]
MRLLLTAFLCIPLLFLSGCVKTTTSENYAAVIINEVVTAGDKYDWIELYNTADEPVFLGDCYLSDNTNDPQKWCFPAVTIQGGEYLVLYADSTATTPFHLPFRLSASGTSLVFSTNDGTILQLLQIPATACGLSYGVNGGVYEWFSTPTIGQSNAEGHVLGNDMAVPSEGLHLSEYMTKNQSVLYDSNGNYSDWVEIHNFSDRAISLSGYSLTDTLGNAAKWTFPAGVSVEAGGYLLVRCSGRDTVTENGEIHTNFKLGTGDAFLALYNQNGRFCCGATIVSLEADHSYGYTDQHGYAVLRYPTPGLPNNTSIVNGVTS